MRDDRDIQRTGTYRGRSRHRLPRREGARIAGRTGGAPQYVPAVYLPRNPCKSVPGVSSCLPPGTEIPRKRVRCHFPPPTWHGILAKAYQVSCPAAYLPRNPRESVPGVSSRCPPGTETLSRPEKCLPGSREYGRLIEWQAGCHLPRSLRTGRACADKLKDCNIVFSISFSYLCFRPEKIINRKDILTTSINPQSL